MLMNLKKIYENVIIFANTHSPGGGGVEHGLDISRWWFTSTRGAVQQSINQQVQNTKIGNVFYVMFYIF